MCEPIRLLTETACGVCGGTVPEGYAVIAGDLEFPIWLVLCMSCASARKDLWLVKAAFDFKGLEWPSGEPKTKRSTSPEVTEAPRRHPEPCEG